MLEIKITVDETEYKLSGVTREQLTNGFMYQLFNTVQSCNFHQIIIVYST